MAIYRGTGGATSVSGDATIEEVLGYATTAQAAAAAASADAAIAAAAAPSAAAAAISEANAATSESNAATSEANAATSESNAATSETNASNAKLYSEEWANKAVDTLVSVAAGGNGVDEYSAKHWATKASEILADGIIDDASTSLLTTWSSTYISTNYVAAPTISAGDAGKAILVNATEDGFVIGVGFDIGKTYFMGNN